MPVSPISPVARRAASALGVDPAGLQGSGPGGRIVKSDVLAAAQPTSDPRLFWLEQMLLIRRFEEAAGQAYNRSQVGGFLHLGIGEEGCIVGSCEALRAQDYLLCTYRSHGHALARGTDPGAVMAELYGKAAGTSGGRGGSMHIFDADNRFLGGYGIVGGNIPLAAGVALAVKRRGEPAGVLCQFGDGAANTGNLAETLNMAALWRLPVVFMITNNQYGMGTALDRHAASPDLYRRGEAYGVEGRRVDGMDIQAVHEAVGSAMRDACDEQRPLLLEALTYRFRGHSAADPEVYRSKQEVQEWKEQRDPIALLALQLKEEALLDEAGLAALTQRAEQAVDQAVAYADQAPAPPEDELLADVYVDSENSREALERRAP